MEDLRIAQQYFATVLDYGIDLIVEPKRLVNAKTVAANDRTIFEGDSRYRHADLCGVG